MVERPQGWEARYSQAIAFFVAKNMTPKEFRQTIYLFIELKLGKIEGRTKSDFSKLLHQYGKVVNANYKEQIEVLYATNTKLRQTITKLTLKK